MTNRKSAYNPENHQTELDSDKIYIPGSKRTPEVKFDKQEGYLSVSGRSLPDNANDFYLPVLKEVDNYLLNPQDTTRILFNLDYLDSSSSQLILALVYKLNKILDAHKELYIEWHYMEDDYDILETGKTYSELTGIDFDFIAHL